VMTDDIYEHILYDKRQFVTPAQVEPALKERTLTINGVSKAYAMTGWRIGYGAGPLELIKAMIKLQSQSTSNASSVAQAGAFEALRGPQGFIAERSAEFQARRDAIVPRINAIAGLHCHTPEGAFYVFPSCQGILGSTTKDGKRIETSDDFVLYLLDSVGLAVLQGTAYGVPPYFRISFATSMKNLEEGCKRLASACAALTR
jgi:aspartate aminotransferase